MGMYTEIIFGAELKEDTPNEVIETIYDLITCDNIDEFKYVPEHDFFKTSRWWMLQYGGSYSFPGRIDSRFYKDNISNTYFLHFRTNIKNYDQEIELFLDWIKQYIDNGSGIGNFYAIVCYEEQKEPTIYYLN